MFLNQINDAAEAMRLDLARLDEAMTAIYAKVRRGELLAIDRMMSILRLRKEILGYGAEVLHRIVIEDQNDDITDEDMELVLAAQYYKRTGRMPPVLGTGAPKIIDGVARLVDELPSQAS